MPCHNYHLPYNTKTCITMWKLETTTESNFVYVSLLKQQGNCDFEVISVSFSAVTVGYIRYQHHTVLLKLYDLKIESFSLESSFYIKKNLSIKKKIHSGLFLSLAITGIDVNNIIRYPSSSLKYHLSILTVF